MVNMSNRASWDDCKRWLRKLDPGWFLGRCVIVVTRVASVSKYAFDRDDITDFIDDYHDIPTIWTNLEEDSEAGLAALQLVRILEIGAGYRRPSRTRTLPSSLLNGAAPVPTPMTTTRSSTIPVTASFASLDLNHGSRLGSRLTATYVFMKCPEKYTIPMTSLVDMEAEVEGGDGDQ